MTCVLVATSLVAVSAAAQEVGYNDLTEVGGEPPQVHKVHSGQQL